MERRRLKWSRSLRRLEPCDDGQNMPPSCHSPEFQRWWDIPRPCRAFVSLPGHPATGVQEFAFIASPLYSGGVSTLMLRLSSEGG